jgi:glucosamine-6-phosphate deaminase
MIDRRRELQEFLKLSPEEVAERAGDHLIVCESIEELHHRFAKDIFTEINNNNENNRSTRLILPIGPTGQYPILVDLILQHNLDLSNCWFFFMDEYSDDDGFALPLNHPLSFKRIAKTMLLIPLREKFGLDNSKVIFPDESNIDELASIVQDINTCYGGIGIHGHIAFNEPSINISLSNPRKVRLNEYTITLNAIRSQVGGNLEAFPNHAFTIGMKQILSAKRIRLYCRNGSSYDWANSVLRIALFGEPGDDYPVTYIRNHPNYTIITDKETLQSPINLI